MFKSSTLAAVICCSAFFLQGCTKQPESNNWKTIFNGKDLDGWVVKINHHAIGEDPNKTFQVQDDMLTVSYENYGDFNEQFGHLFYEQPLKDFRLKFEYRFKDEFLESAPAYAFANSGVMFMSQAPATINLDQNWPVSVEFQLLAERQKGVSRPTGNMCSPGTDIYYNDEVYPEHCLNSSSATFESNLWVEAELIVEQGNVTQKINGETVLEYKVAFARKDDLVAGENASVWQEMADLNEGYIGFQSEGQPIDFRNIQLQKL